MYAVLISTNQIRALKIDRFAGTSERASGDETVHAAARGGFAGILATTKLWALQISAALGL